jgi:hypothetical protein
MWLKWKYREKKSMTNENSALTPSSQETVGVFGR